MKRDMDMIRDLLLKIEGGQIVFKILSKETGPSLGIPADDLLPHDDAEKLRMHLDLLEEAGLISKIVRHGGGHYHIERMTWEGYDFLDTVRDPEVWKRTKEGASKMGGWTFGLLKDLGSAYLKHVAKERLGLDL